MSSSDSKIKELSALAERLRNRTLRTEPPATDSVIEQLRKENASLKRIYQKALQLLALYKQRLEVDLMGSTSDLLGRVQHPNTVPRDPLLDVHFSSDDEEDSKENKFSKPHSASSPSLLQRYLHLQKPRTTAELPDTRESLDLAESLNRDSGSLSKMRLSNPQPPSLPIEGRIRDRN